MKQPTHSQQWYDCLCRIYNIGDFPPLHSFSFTDWHWINEDDIEKDRSFKVVPSASLSNDYWTMIMDDDESESEQLASQILYSDAVRHSSPANVIFRPSNTKWRNSTPAHLKKHGAAPFATDHCDNEDEHDDLWFQHKNTRHYNQQQRQRQRRVLVTGRSLKPRTSAGSCLGDKKNNHEQRKRHVRKLTHQGKSPIRLVRHQNRHCARYYNH